MFYDWKGAMYAAIAVVMVLGALWVGSLEEGVRIACIRAGYPNYTWNLYTGGFCSKLVDGTTIVVEVEKVKSPG